MRAFLVGSLCVCALLAEGLAEAHKRSVERALFLEPAGSRGLEVLIVIQVPGSSTRRALDAVADQNHDGLYDERERLALERHLLQRALDGLMIRSGTTALGLEGLEAKTRVNPSDGPVAVMAHATVRLPPGPPSRLSVSTAPVGDHLDLTVLSGDREVRDASRGRVTRAGLQVQLGHGDEVSFRLE